MSSYDEICSSNESALFDGNPRLSKLASTSGLLKKLRYVQAPNRKSSVVMVYAPEVGGGLSLRSLRSVSTKLGLSEVPTLRMKPRVVQAVSI